MKILDGELNESVYHTPTAEGRDAPLKIKKNTTYQPNEVAYISDQIGLHRVVNPSQDRLAVSLHCTFTDHGRSGEYGLTNGP
jgi:cysteine dioxygenase